MQNKTLIAIITTVVVLVLISVAAADVLSPKTAAPSDTPLPTWSMYVGGWNQPSYSFTINTWGGHIGA